LVTYAVRLRFAGFCCFDALAQCIDGADFLADLYTIVQRGSRLGGMMRWNNDYRRRKMWRRGVEKQDAGKSTGRKSVWRLQLAVVSRVTVRANERALTVTTHVSARSHAFCGRVTKRSTPVSDFPDTVRPQCSPSQLPTSKHPSVYPTHISCLIFSL
jgi:hypothetical protein